MNLLNYIDRYVVTALLPQLQAELGLTDSQGGFLGTAFMVVYFFCSPFFGWLGDLGARPRWLGLGVISWSLATALAGLTNSFGQLFFVRALVGVGEAAYGSIAPSLITDWFEKRSHGRALSVFYLATPVGSALGYLLGGYLGVRLGWRNAFFVVGLPGMILGLGAFQLTDPSRPKLVWPQPIDSPGPIAKRRLAALWRQTLAQVMQLMRNYKSLWHNKLYRGTVMGYTAYTFALGGFAFWAPSFMIRERGFAQQTGMLAFGCITVGSGIVGTLMGGVLGDALQRRFFRGSTYMSIVSVILGAIFSAGCLIFEQQATFFICMIAAQLCLFINTGPVNALIVGSVPSAMRGSAMALSIFCIHLFGDAFSPVLIGWISDHSDLAHAMFTVPIVFVVAALIWLATLLQERRARC